MSWLFRTMALNEARVTGYMKGTVPWRGKGDAENVLVSKARCDHLSSLSHCTWGVSPSHSSRTELLLLITPRRSCLQRSRKVLAVRNGRHLSRKAFCSNISIFLEESSEHRSHFYHFASPVSCFQVRSVRISRLPQLIVGIIIPQFAHHSNLKKRSTNWGTHMLFCSIKWQLSCEEQSMPITSSSTEAQYEPFST